MSDLRVSHIVHGTCDVTLPIERGAAMRNTSRSRRSVEEELFEGESQLGALLGRNPFRYLVATPTESRYRLVVNVCGIPLRNKGFLKWILHVCM
ncbi:hypothetical protein J6590_035626 [Homalodisca vitripennis]|nr:hypothetical protein J6590_035626 [Homalodisca vitripennis]